MKYPGFSGQKKFLKELWKLMTKPGYEVFDGKTSDVIIPEGGHDRLLTKLKAP